MPNETAIKMLIGAAIVVAMVLGFIFLKNHYIGVGVAQEQNRVAEVAAAEALRQAQAKADALKDSAFRVEGIKQYDNKLGGALNSSEVLNHEEIDSPCLSDSRRLRINDIR